MHSNSVRVGDQYRHNRWGIGIIVFINSNPMSKYPIKMHFREAALFAFFDTRGMQYKYQPYPEINFPRVEQTHYGQYREYF